MNPIEYKQKFAEHKPLRGNFKITVDIATNILEKLDNRELIKFKKTMKFAPVWVSNYLCFLI